MIDSGLIQEYCQEMKKGTNPGQAELAFQDLIQMYDSIVSLLRTCVQYDSPIRVEILADTDALEAIVSLLLIECDGKMRNRPCNQELTSEAPLTNKQILHAPFSLCSMANSKWLPWPEMHSGRCVQC